MKNKTTIYVLCSPNIGLLDNWLPVVFRLNELKSNFNFVLIFSDAEVISTINFNNAIIKLSNSIFHSVLLYSPSELWIKMRSLKSSKKNIHFLWRFLNYFKRFNNRFLFANTFLALLKKLCIIVDEFKYKGSIIDLKHIVLKNDILLYDVHVHTNPIDLNIVSKFNNNYKFSIPHGINTKLNLTDFEKDNTYNKNSKLKLLIFSKDLQYEYYLKKYGISPKNIIIVGIPRHDQKWINKIQEQSDKLPINFRDDNTVFIISCPVSACLPRDRKIKSLEDVRNIIIDNLKMKVVIKLHPKELKERIYEDVFKTKHYGKTWIYSDLHPLALAKGRRLTISLFSGVSFDMLRLGIPCVEYIDLKDIPGFEIVNNKPVTTFTSYGFVTGVSNYDEFKFQVEKILKSSDYDLASKKIYSDYFPMDNESSSRTASIIIQSTLDNN